MKIIVGPSSDWLTHYREITAAADKAKTAITTYGLPPLQPREISNITAIFATEP
jgi:hypothetical protein